MFTLDELINVSNTAQFLLIWGVNPEFEVTEELASVNPLHGTIGEYFERSWGNKFGKTWNRIWSVVTNDGTRKCEVKKDLVEKLT